jgi:hypothetical protein
VSAANTSKSKSNSKPAAKPAPKAAKPASKAAKPAKATKKPAAKLVTKAAPKAAGKAAGKTAAGKPAAKVAAKSAGKPVAKPAAKSAAKPVAKSSAPIAVKAQSGKEMGKGSKNKLPVKAPKAMAKDAVLVEAETAADAEFAEDLAAQDVPGLEGVSADLIEEAAVQEEPLSPSAALLRSMKPTSPDAEKAGEKKKKKDDLKLDRNGDLEAQWAQLKEKYKALKPAAYKMSESFEARTPILHKVLGWGFIITNQNDRLEVLFQQGIKFLISNYKA